MWDAAPSVKRSLVVGTNDSGSGKVICFSTVGSDEEIRSGSLPRPNRRAALNAGSARSRGPRGLPALRPSAASGLVLASRPAKPLAPAGEVRGLAQQAAHLIQALHLDAKAA